MSEPSQPRVLSLRDATMLVVSSVIGVGIFLTPGDVARLLPTPFWFGLAWAAGGALSLAGALANAELGAMFPRAGGNYVYLRAAYHPVVGFVAGWVQFFAIFAGTIATLAVGFSLTLGSIVPLSSASKLVLAFVLVGVTSAVNAYATRAGARVNTWTGYAKVAALVIFVAASPFAASAPDLLPRVAPSVAPSAFGAALSPILFSYLGWNASVYVAGEIARPERNLPRSLFWGLGLCALVYLLVSGTYVRVLGMDALVGGGDEPAAVTAGRVIFGAHGAGIVTAMMLVSIFGALNANVLTGPRIVYAMANDGLFFRSAALLSETSRTPWVAVVVQAVAACVLVVAFDEFPSILDYTTFAIVLATIADTSALYVLRVRAADRPRPYRAAGYPIVPALYVVANVLIGASMMWHRPTECLASVGVIASGIAAYVLFSRLEKRRSRRAVEPALK